MSSFMRSFQELAPSCNMAISCSFVDETILSELLRVSLYRPTIRRMRQGLCGLILFSVVTFHVSAIQADEALEASGLCYKIQNFINALAKYTDTLCIPGLGQEGVIFLLLSKEPIFSVEASKKAWLVVTVGAVGKVMNMHQTIKASEVYVSDMNLMKNRLGFKYPVDLAKRLQQQAAEAQLEIDEFYGQLNRALASADISSIERQD